MGAFLREAIANGVTKVTDLYNAAVKYIMDKWTNIFGDEMLMEKRSIDDWKEKAKEALKKAKEALKKFTEKALEKFKITSEVIKQKVLELVAKGKLKIEDKR